MIDELQQYISVAFEIIPTDMFAILFFDCVVLLLHLVVILKTSFLSFFNMFTPLFSFPIPQHYLIVNFKLFF